MGFAISSNRRRWLGGIVPYRFHSSVVNDSGMRTVVEDAIELWNADTCIELVPREDAPPDYQTDYVEFRVSSDQCNSPIGRRSGRQIVQCGYQSVGSIAHEIGHAVGLYHEHNRPDRHPYVVFTDYALNGAGGTYSLRTDGLVLGPYDCRSIMHYRPYERRIQPVPQGGCAQIGNSTLGAGDIAAIAHMYRLKVRASEERHSALAEVAVASGFPQGRLLVARREETGGVWVELYSVDTRANVRRLSQWNTGQVAEASLPGIDVVPVSRQRFVTLHRTPQGRLALKAWQIDGRSLTEQEVPGPQQPPGILRGRIASLGGGRLLTASIEPTTRNLRVDSWTLRFDGRIKKASETVITDFAFREVSLSVLNANLAATTVIRSDGTLRVLTWQVSQEGAVQKLDEDGVGGSKSRISSAVDDHGNLITSCRVSQGRLILISWRVLRSTGEITRLMDSADQAGGVLDTAIVAQDGKVITAVRTNSHLLKLIAWRTSAAGALFRDGDSALQGADTLNGLALAAAESSIIVSAIRKPGRHNRGLILTPWLLCRQ